MRRSGILAILLAVCPIPASADCEIGGVASVDRLRVRVAGAGIHTFAVEDLPIAILPGRGSLYRRARVIGPLSFEARTDAPIPWTVTREGSIASGLLWWTRGARIDDVRELSDDEVELRARLAPGVFLDRVRVPCASMRVGAAQDAIGTPPRLGEGPRVIPRDSRTYLWSGPGTGANARLEIEAQVWLLELERRGGWVHVGRRFDESGAVLSAWTREGDIAPAPQDDPPSGAPPAVAHVTEPACARRARPADQYLGPAQIRAGTLVRAQRDGPAWAQVPVDAPVTISWRPGEPWARIVEVRGLSGDGRCPGFLGHAWVPRRSIRLQGEE